MPRNTLTPIETPGAYDVAGADFAWTALDSVNGDQFALTGKEVVLVRNVDVSIHNLTVTSVADSFQRTGNIDSSNGGDIPANGFRMFGPFKAQGWQQSDGMLYLDTDDANLEVAILRVVGL